MTASSTATEGREATVRRPAGQAEFHAGEAGRHQGGREHPSIGSLAGRSVSTAGAKARPPSRRALPRKLQNQLALCTSFPDRILFLDIETTGLSHFYDEITIVGWTFGGTARTLLKGQDPSPLVKDAARAKALVTFNGIRFDTKFIAKELPQVTLPETHIDLMYLCRRVGLKGGQKAIEKELGIRVRANLAEMDGAAAVVLWHRYMRGDAAALRKLIHYNRADIAAMGAILDLTVPRFSFHPDLFPEDTCFQDWSAPEGWRDLSGPMSDTARYAGTPPPRFGDLFGGTPAEGARVVGIDLTGSEARGSGWCFLNGSNAEVAVLLGDDEILEKTMKARPELVSIDSPLCLPQGRISVYDTDPGRDEFGIMRESERELKRRGVNAAILILLVGSRCRTSTTVDRPPDLPRIESQGADGLRLGVKSGAKMRTAGINVYRAITTPEPPMSNLATVATETALTTTDRTRIAAALEDSLSPATRRAYRTAWNAWIGWCDGNGHEPLPAGQETVAAYPTARAESGASMSTIRMACSAINAAHETAGHASPTKSPAITGRRSVVAGLAKRAAREGRGAHRQVGALTSAALAAIRATARTPRKTGRGLESTASARQRGIVDIALCQVLRDAGLRRSEAAALTWGDVRQESDGSGRIHIAWSKTDQAGEGATVAITRQAVRALAAIRNGAPDDAGVFGLSPSQISRRVKAAAEAAGLGSDFAGHSGRVGLARKMVAARAPSTVILLQGRWGEERMIKRYARAESVGAALAYLEDDGE